MIFYILTFSLVNSFIAFDLVNGYSYDSTIISWSGYNWRIKEGYRSPGPNEFTVDSVQLTNNNKTLSMILQPMANGSWSNAEIYTIGSLGYGTYSWVISSETANLPAQVTFGMFTWEDWSTDKNSREIDIEFAKWGNESDPRNIQFTVQPHTVPGNARRFELEPSSGITRTEFTWSPCGVSFRTYKYNSTTITNPEKFISHNDKINHVLSGKEKVHINLWLWASQAPETDGQPIKLDIESFTFTPLTQTNPEYIMGQKSFLYSFFPYIRSHGPEFNSTLTKELASIFDILQKFVLDQFC